MCGIFAVFGLTGDQAANRRKVVELSKRIRHRGPDWESTWTDGKGNFVSHQRLAIVSPGESGNQPCFLHQGTDAQKSWVVNGEIYNYVKLKEEHKLEDAGTSDSAVVGSLYQKYGTDMVSMLDGMFAFALYDSETGRIFAGRDHMGISSMYVGYGKDGSVWFASEMKSFVNEPMIESYDIFPPGHMYTGGPGGKGFERWYKPQWVEDESYVPTTPVDYEVVRETVVNSVVKRLMTDVPFGVLLSGGLDSSVVASVANRHLEEARNNNVADHKLHTFSIGIKGAPDLVAAKKVADFLGTEHHEFHFTPQEAIDAIPDVVYHLESYEQVRASVPMFLLSRKIKSLGVKMVLSGEGADETLGGYLYFHKAPSGEEFHKECVRKTVRLHQWDVMRANKSTLAWGLEARVPFLDKEWLKLVMNIRPEDKMIDMADKPDGKHARSEKYLLRKAFDTPEDPYLPESVLFRQKEQFSDGVGYDWVDGLKDYAEATVSDEEFNTRNIRFPKNTPETKEYYLLRSLFEKYYPEPCALDTVPTGKSIACSTPEAVSWCPEWENSTGDISGRAVDVHESSKDFDLEDSTMHLLSCDEVAGPKAPSNGAAPVPSAVMSAGAPARRQVAPKAAFSLRQQFKANMLRVGAPRAASRPSMVPSKLPRAQIASAAARMSVLSVRSVCRAL
uniref:asparagine synthase (glutamine-hydrolyzing) n=1 Tax=Pyramimonas obovata TaxID=1411642 RepID=A0A6T7VL96_9CHLO|mmetsp:Transcript_21486/g.47125  ORF Transcript_21486/g.47125 Transcript_21486/m.47125 type:complete len:673 (+) Transcript_21486:105-2123(+)|eukprot:CAMPEP_0118927998 /NCGR_PEP_ID=MMETSP1169-20130426/5356_1 /TAXON_ID=36882 /ORGANISM="Pyramimonas obovata, Strain CCMP722" /LENGTH=672 /DNA_ID=CAMNT_0006869885 /DNA_START=70 /DNA_END=2088 /DNA_ORIENTATION=+